VTGGFGEPDDAQSLVRLLLYANEFDIEGLVATYSPHWGDAKPEYIQAMIGAYGKVWEQLRKHDERYPDPDKLLYVMEKGDTNVGKRWIHEMTPGSERLLKAVESDDPRPLWVIAWGGTNVLAKALFNARHSRTDSQFQELLSKLRVYAIADQDYTGSYIRRQFSTLMYIKSSKSFRGMYCGGDPSLVTSEWVDTHVRAFHGTLGAAYPNYDGYNSSGPVKGVKEGDTPSLLYLIPNGLGDPEHPEWGSWGGRFQASREHQYADACDEWDSTMNEGNTVARWREAYQADFQARLDWCVKGFEEANHAPIVKVEGDLVRMVYADEPMTFDASASEDPDGDDLSFYWEIYPEAGSYSGEVPVDQDGHGRASLKAPQVEQDETLHLILTVTDHGGPRLRSYARFIIQVKAQEAKN
jgi:hypothetical protein